MLHATEQSVLLSFHSHNISSLLDIPFARSRRVGVGDAGVTSQARVNTG